MHPLKKAVLILACVALGTLTVVLGTAVRVGLELGSILHKTQPSVDLTVKTIGIWFDCKKNPACLTSDALGTFKAIEKAAGQSYKASIQAEKAAVEVTGLVKDTRKDVHDLLSQATGLTADLRTNLNLVLGDADKTVRAGDQVLQTASQTLLPLKRTLENIDTLTKTLNDQVAVAAPAAVDTVNSLNQAIQDLDVLLANPDIKLTLANVAGTSGHLNESAKSIDLALRPWREKANMLKTVLSKALGMLKFTAPLF